ncbi:uncharacterized protein LOC133337919, partial [Musca vetustissima]|uniref:uncharacterized protein LOC133337919 n=1 Tax=Musca vetustissima TaxID=27455 RepID=UPI002AB7E52A
MDSAKEGTKKKYAAGFREEWKEKFPWLNQVKGGKKCVVCDIQIAGGLSHIERHASRECHKKIFNIYNMPFTILDHLNQIIKSGIPDSQITKKFLINRHKAQQIINNTTGPENTKFISKFCNENYYSIVIDESTDCTVSKHLAIIIRTFNGKCQDRFLSLEYIVESTGKGIADTIIDVLRNCNIPLDKMIGFTADNCSVMMGKNNGVQAILKLSVPNLFVTGCVCHILNLASCAAFSVLPPE